MREGRNIIKSFKEKMLSPMANLREQLTQTLGNQPLHLPGTQSFPQAERNVGQRLSGTISQDFGGRESTNTECPFQNPSEETPESTSVVYISAQYGSLLSTVP